jgi:uridine kinase
MQTIKTFLLFIYSFPTTSYLLIKLFFDVLKIMKNAKKNNEPTVDFTEIITNFIVKIDENRNKIIHINGIIWILIILIIFK